MLRETVKSQNKFINEEGLSEIKRKEKIADYSQYYLLISVF